VADAMAVAQISRSARRREVAGIPGTVPALPGAHRRATRARGLPATALFVEQQTAHFGAL